MKKKNFIQDQKGHKGGETSDFLCDALFVFAKQNLC